jgi:hypothetical protein
MPPVSRKQGVAARPGRCSVLFDRYPYSRYNVYQLSLEVNGMPGDTKVFTGS